MAQCRLFIISSIFFIYLKSKHSFFEQGNKVAIVKIDVAGDELLAERRCKTFEEAIDLCLDAIKKQIDKYKEKRR